VQAIDRPAFFPLDPARGLSLKQRHFLNPIRGFFGHCQADWKNLKQNATAGKTPAIG
jgi:hypothetical protein